MPLLFRSTSATACSFSTSQPGEPVLKIRTKQDVLNALTSPAYREVRVVLEAYVASKRERSMSRISIAAKLDSLEEFLLSNNEIIQKLRANDHTRSSLGQEVIAFRSLEGFSKSTVFLPNSDVTLSQLTPVERAELLGWSTSSSRPPPVRPREGAPPPAYHRVVRHEDDQRTGAGVPPPSYGK